MSNLRILIVEDDIFAKKTLQGILKKLGYSKFYSARNSTEAEEIILKVETDLVFLDIGLTESVLDGVDLGVKINKQSSNCKIIFTTGYSDLGTLERIKQVAHDNYLLKPLEERQISVAINRLFQESSNSEQRTNHSSNVQIPSSSKPAPVLFVKTQLDKYYYRLPVDQIRYIRAEDGGIHITTHDNTYFIYTSLVKALNQLGHDQLIRVHRSYVVNPDYILAKNENEIVMQEDFIIPIGRSYREMVNKVLPSFRT